MSRRPVVASHNAPQNADNPRGKPQNPSLLLALELNLKVAILDPIGEPEIKTYKQLLEKMAQAFLACLADSSVTGEV